MGDARTWERLPDALERIQASGCSREVAQQKICQAIEDGTVEFRGKLKKHATRSSTSGAVLETIAFEIPSPLPAHKLDWENSRPAVPWTVKHGSYSVAGRWFLEWIELFTADVSRILCPRDNRHKPQKSFTNKSAIARARPSMERASRALEALYPNGVPEQAVVPNAVLCREVGDKLQTLRLPDVSDDTILRAAGRRK